MKLDFRSKNQQRSGLGFDNVDFFTPEFDGAVALGKQGVIVAHADVETGMELGAALAHQDRAGFGELAAVEFDAAILRVAVASVSG